MCFFYKYPAHTESDTYLHTLALHDALPSWLKPISPAPAARGRLSSLMKAGMNFRCRSRRRCSAGSARKAAEFRPVLGHGRTGAPDDRETAASGNDRMRPALFQDQAFHYEIGRASGMESVFQNV